MKKAVRKYHIIYAKNEQDLKDIVKEFGAEEGIIKHSAVLDGIERVFFELRTRLTIADRNDLIEMYNMKSTHRIKDDVPKNCEWIIGA